MMRTEEYYFTGFRCPKCDEFIRIENHTDKNIAPLCPNCDEYMAPVNEPKIRQWQEWECKIMNIIDVRYWACECHYMAPYGLVIMADCSKHDG